MFIIKYIKDLDPLDPLTEIIRSGQAFSSFIILERLIWLFIGLFFIAAMTNGLKNGLKVNGLNNNKTSFIEINKKSEKKDTSLKKDNE